MSKHSVTPFRTTWEFVKKSQGPGIAQSQLNQNLWGYIPTPSTLTFQASVLCKPPQVKRYPAKNGNQGTKQAWVPPEPSLPPATYRLEQVLLPTGRLTDWGTWTLETSSF